MGDFLGTGNVAAVDREYRPFDEVRDFARGLHLRSGDEWAVFARGEMPDKERLPPDVPRAPQVVFRGRGWAGWGDFLGTGNIASIDRDWRAFREARRFVRGLGLGSRTEWGEFIRRETLVHPDLPKDPARAYAGKGWRGWCDFLGVARRSRPRRAWRSFEEARRFAREIGFRSSHEWERWSRGDRPDLAPRPADIPGVPYVAYAKDGWLGWRDFLGTEAKRVGT